MRGQRGVTLSGFLLWSVVLVFAALLLFKIGPPYVEFMTIQSNLKAVANDPEGRSGVRRVVEDLFDRRSAIENISSVKARDIIITKEGDGFWTVVDPENPDIIYAESQYGVLSRFDRRTGENHDIQPQAAAGEYAIGDSFAFSGVKMILEGYPIALVIPSEGAGYEIEVNALMKTSKNKAVARKFLDWLLTLDAAKLYGERAEMSSVPGAVATPAVLKAGLPADVSTVLYTKMDFAASAKNKDRIVNEWKQRIER